MEKFEFGVLAGLSLALLASCGGGGGSSDGGKAGTPLANQYLTVQWQDDFSLDSPGEPNPAYWAMLLGNGREYGIPGWGTGQAQYYLPGNATVNHGVLNLRGHYDPALAAKNCYLLTCAFSSGMVTSMKTVDLSRAGYLEIKATIPTAEGSWPALWLLPGRSPGAMFPPASGTETSSPSWPSGGEIDMVEYMWANMSPNTSAIATTLHLPQPAADGVYINKYGRFNDLYDGVTTYPASVASTSHLYQLLWTPAQIQFAIDDVIVMTCKKANMSCQHGASGGSYSFPPGTTWPFGTVANQYYLTMNLGIGGWAGITNGNNALIPTSYDQTMQISSVRYLTP